MSNAVFPALAGLGWSVKRTEMWKTRIQESISGKEVRIADWSYPRHQWELTYDFLRSDPSHGELQSLLGFFDLRQGPFDSFLYQDADDNAIAGQQIGTGDGSTRIFQLARNFGGFIEPIIAPNVVSTVYLAGVAQNPSGYGVGSTTGQITFVTAPGAGVAITADFSYYFRCRFVGDAMDFEKFMVQLWLTKKVLLVSLKSS